MRIQLLLASIVLLCLAPATLAQDDFRFWTDDNYDPSIPTIEQVLGYAPGEQITWHRDTVRYFEALAAAAPDRVQFVEYAQSWQGRELIYVVLSSAENMARIDDVKAGMQALRDPRQTSSGEAAALIENQPPVTWLSYGVHGNEISSTDAAMLTAYHLLASRGDARVPDIMNNTVVVIDPMQNPDGPRPFHPPIHNRTGPRARFRPALGGARRALARRPHQPLPVRHEPGLVHHDPAGNPGPR